jgi:hypothetical protein
LGTYERETTGARSCCTVHDPGTTKLLPSTQLPLPILINCSLMLCSALTSSKRLKKAVLLRDYFDESLQ